jgi:hypothetical protein
MQPACEIVPENGADTGADCEPFLNHLITRKMKERGNDTRDDNDGEPAFERIG